MFCKQAQSSNFSKGIIIEHIYDLKVTKKKAMHKFLKKSYLEKSIQFSIQTQDM